MTDDEINAAAMTDAENPPLTPDQLAQFRRPHLAKIVRRKLRMDRKTFATTYGIPLEALTTWERYEVDPSPTEVAYLKLIERAPDVAKLQAAE